MSDGPDRVALAAFAGAVLIGGTNFVGVRYSNRGLDPLWGSSLRFALAAAIFALVVAAFRMPLPRGRTLALLVLYGLVGFGFAYACMYLALQDVPAGIAAVVMAVGPLLVLLLAVLHGMETLTRRALVAAVVAFVGSVLIFFQPGSVSFELTSLLLLGLAALAASESVVISKRIGRVQPAVMNLVGMTAGSLATFVAAVVAGETLALPARGETQVALVYLVLATVGLFYCVLVVVQRWSASSTAYSFVLMPIVAVALGALIAGEPVTVTTVVGGAVVCLAVWYGAATGGTRGRRYRGRPGASVP